MVDDGPSEKSQGSCRRSRRTRRCVIAGEEAILSIDAVRHPFTPAGYANMGACLARPDRTIKIPPGRDPGRAKAERKDDAR
jgi:hypothetical protein